MNADGAPDTRPTDLDALRRREERLRLAVEATGAGVWDTHADAGEPFVSPHIEALLGYAPLQTPRALRALLRHVVADDRPRVLERLRRARATGAPFTIDCRVTNTRGQIRWVHLRGRFIDTPSRTAPRSIGTIVDITSEFEANEARLEAARTHSLEELRRAEQQAQRDAQMHHAQKLESLGLLAGGIAHDFNNLLVGVLSNASLALLDLEERSPVRGIVLDIERTAQRAADLTRQLLAYSGKGRFVVESLDLSALAREMSQLLRTVVSKDATLHLELDEALPPIEGDATQLRQVIMNLITNASDALSGRPGTIAIRTGQGLPVARDDTMTFGEACTSNEVVWLEVSDSGIGMTRDVAERIFDPFFSTKFTGRGLGLAATLGIVRGHHGAITLETTPGQGTRLRLCFPTLRAPAVTEVAPPRPAEHARSGRVLVVDDDRVVRSVTSALLTRQGYAVTTVESGQDALEELAQRSESFAFALIDLTMPGLTGVEVLEQWRARERREGRSPLPVVLMSGYTEVDVAPHLADLQVSGFLQKPFTLAAVEAMIDALPAT
ncbi:MAG: response regulator [Gemmatimonadaceae bacterium]|nr:response regulator [Gemmatimonadaceae bacterium]